MIKAPLNDNLSELKKLVKEETKNGILGGIDAKELVLSKVSTSLWPLPSSPSDHPCNLTN